MQIELNADEIHWIQYALIMAIAGLPPGSEAKPILEGILEKLPLSDRSHEQN